MSASANNAELDRTACAVADAAHAAQSSATAGDIVCAANIAENPYKRDFPLLANHPDLVFLDSAATAQRPAAVLDAQRRFYYISEANSVQAGSKGNDYYDNLLAHIKMNGGSVYATEADAQAWADFDKWCRGGGV